MHGYTVTTGTQDEIGKASLRFIPIEQFSRAIESILNISPIAKRTVVDFIINKVLQIEMRLVFYGCCHMDTPKRRANGWQLSCRTDNFQIILNEISSC